MSNIWMIVEKELNLKLIFKQKILQHDVYRFCDVIGRSI